MPNESREMLDFNYGDIAGDVEIKGKRPRDSKNARNLEKLRERGEGVYERVMAKIEAAQTKIRTCAAYQEIGTNCLSNYV